MRKQTQDKITPDEIQKADAMATMKAESGLLRIMPTAPILDVVPEDVVPEVPDATEPTTAPGDVATSTTDDAPASNE